MKSEITSPSVPQPGIIDALGAGLSLALRRPWLLLVPVFIDLWLWLAPRISIAPILERMLANWENFLGAYYTPAQLAAFAPMLQNIREASAQLSSQVNLAEGLTGGWLGAPSMLAQGQVTRMTFISDLVLAPAGLALQLPHAAPAPFQAVPIQVGGLGGVVLCVSLFWLIGQVLLALYMYLAGGSTRRVASGKSATQPPAFAWSGVRGYLGLFARLAVFGLLIGAVILILRMPLAFAIMMLVMTSNSVLALIALLFGGIALWLTLWVLLALFFVNEGMLLEGRPLARSLALSVGVVHRNFGATIGLVALINLIMYGFRIVWDLLAVTPAGVAVAIVGNAFLATGMLLATFAYFEGLRRAAVARKVKSET